MEDIKICEYTVQEYAKLLDYEEEIVFEWFGQDVVKLYIAQRGDEESAYAGVQHEDGSYSVYGLRRDEEHITYQHMVAVMKTGF